MLLRKEEIRHFSPTWAAAVLVLLVLVTTLPTLVKKRGNQARQPMKPLAEQQFQVDINHASVIEIQALPSVGPKLAKRIESYRIANGPFTSLNELQNVHGIGEKLLRELQPYLTINTDNEASLLNSQR